MSILLIGQRCRHRSFQREPLDDEDCRREKKQAQERYRAALLTQMNENSQRRRRQRQIEIQADRKYELIFKQQRTELDKINTVPHVQLTPVSRYEHRDSSETIAPKFSLPPIQDSTINARLSRFKTESLQKPSEYKRSLRLATEHGLGHSFSPYPNNPEELESSQLRQQKLQEQLEAKLNKVYELMAQSAKPLYTSDQLNSIGSRMSPIKLGLDQDGFRVNYPDYVSPSYSSPSKDLDYFKLPNIANSFSEEGGHGHKAEAEWREWYAREKLRQLQSKYRKQLNVEMQDIRLGSRV